MDGFYTHAELRGVAWQVIGPDVEVDVWGDDPDGRATGMVIAVMVGDDRKHIVDPDDLTPISEDEFCAGCGQVGCGH